MLFIALAVAASATTTVSGTGFHFHRPGLFVTNNHVVERADELYVSLDGQACPARVLKHDDANDLALLTLESGCALDELGPPLVARGLGLSRMGETSLVLGYPLAETFELNPVASEGMVKSVSGLSGNPTRLTISNALLPGNSGGPVIDGEGRLMGVAVAVANPAYFYEHQGTLATSLNFA
ncbi:MAG: serine protease, partial [Myxococcota bacterium]